MTVCGILLLLPLVMLGWLRLRFEDRLEEIQRVPDPIEIAVAQRSETSARGVQLIATWGEPVAIAAPPWSGTVTGLSINRGAVIKEGDRVITIDGIDRVAVMTEHPPYRSLARGDAGSDVVQAQALLGRLGLYEGENDGVYGLAMMAAARSFATQIGVERPDGTLEPSWFVWFPTDEFPVGDVDVAVGFPAPSPGAEWITGIAPLDDVRIAGQDDAAIDLSGRWKLQVDKTVMAVVDSEIVANEEELANLFLATGSVMGAQDGEQTESQLTGELELAEPKLVVEAPATAVVTSTAGDLCIYRTSGDTYAPVMVEIGPSRTGLVDVRTGLQPGDVILVNPGDVLKDPSC